MIPQFGFAEMIVLALLAIIVVGPKDLPKLMRSMGQFMAKIRGLGQEFKDAFEDMGADDDIAAMRREIEELKKMGQLENLSDDAFMEDMRELDQAIKDDTSAGGGTDIAANTDKGQPDAAAPKGQAE